MVACECSFSLCKFHFESLKRRFFTLKDFHRNKIGKYTTHKRILAFSRVFPQSTLTLFAKYGLYYKIIKKTCNYILKIYATRTDIGIFEGTRSYAALRAADQDWIVGPGYSLGGYILEKNHENQPKTMKNQPGTIKNHEKPIWNHEKPCKPT